MHIILVGLPGSGKTTVGRLVAAELSIPFIDVDVHVAADLGMSVAEIFDRLGEDRFRQAESSAVIQLVESADFSVLAPGGGWAAQPGNLESVAGRSFCVYLETSPETAARRVSAEETGIAGRPLISGGRELLAMAALLMNRERYYVRAHSTVRTDDRSAEQVAAEVAELARNRGAV